MKYNFTLDTCTNSVSIESIENGRKKTKEIGTKDFINLVSSTKIESGKFKAIISPIMNEYEDIKLIQWAKLDKSKYLHVFIKKASKNYMQIYEDSYGYCGYPTLIFGIVTVNENFNRMFLTVSKDLNITENTLLFKYPFSNVSNYSFSVCTGGNRINYKLNTIEDFNKVIDSFFYMPNTFESFSLDCNSKSLDFRALVETLKNTSFDEDLLIQNNSHPTYKDFIETITK